MHELLSVRPGFKCHATTYQLQVPRHINHPETQFPQPQNGTNILKDSEDEIKY